MSAPLVADIPLFTVIRSFALLLALSRAIALPAQLLDSIALFTAQQPRFVAKLDIRGSFIRNQNVRIMGAKVGLEHAGRFQYGIGYSFLFTPVTSEQVVEGVGLTELALRVGYVTPYVDYAFYQRGRWEIRLPVQIGIGGASTVYTDSEGNKQYYQRTGLILYEPAMTVQYRFMRYLAIGGGWGFRLAWQTGDKLGENLNAPIYGFGLRVFFGDLWNDLSGKVE
jgi:hypothetical protein